MGVLYDFRNTGGAIDRPLRHHGEGFLPAGMTRGEVMIRVSVPLCKGVQMDAGLRSVDMPGLVVTLAVGLNFVLTH